MRSQDLFLAVLCGLYFVDLWWIVPRNTIVFRGFGARLNWLSAIESGLSIHKNLVLVRMGALPFGRAHATDFPFLRNDADGRRIIAWPLVPSDTTEHRSETLNGTLSADGARLFQNEIEVLRFSSNTAAGRAANGDAAPLAQPQWVRERVDNFARTTRILRISTTLLSVHVFFGITLALRGIIDVSWIWLLAVYVAILFTTQFLFFFGHRRLYPKDSFERWTKTLAMLLSPPEAMLAVYTLGRGLLSGCHPLVVAKAICGEKDFRELAERLARGSLITTPENRASLVQLLHDLGLRFDDLIHAPTRDAECQSYCPRCLAQFTEDPMRCPDCTGVKTERFEKQVPGRVHSHETTLQDAHP